MLNITFTPDSWEDYLYWQQTDKKIQARINSLIKDIQRNKYKGIGKTEFLKENLTGFVLKRINNEHRLVFKITGNNIEIVQLRYHY